MSAQLNGVSLAHLGHVDGSLPALPGIYVITKLDGTVVDVGETSSLKERISCHERRPCWWRNGANQVWFHYQPNRTVRLLTESRLRFTAKPACGIK